MKVINCPFTLALKLGLFDCTLSFVQENSSSDIAQKRYNICFTSLFMPASCVPENLRQTKKCITGYNPVRMVGYSQPLLVARPLLVADQQPSLFDSLLVRRQQWHQMASRICGFTFPFPSTSTPKIIIP